MPDLSHHTNELCDEFRSRWTVATSGVAGVAQFIGKFGSRVDLDRRILVSLIQVDLEKSWSHWSTLVDGLVQRSPTVDMLLDQWKQLPRFQNYAALFSGPEELCHFWAQLADHEAVCRDRWGDAIGAPFYQHYFEVHTSGFARRQRRHLRCEFEHNEDYSQVLFPLRGRNEIGRQRTKDSDSYFFEANPDGNRIVVANRYESEVSREQLSLQLLTPTFAVIINRSTVNSIRLSPEIVLKPGAKATASFPFTIQIPGRRLCCY